MAELWTQWTQIPEFMMTLGVLGTILIQVLVYLVRKKVIKFNSIYPTISTILEGIIAGGARATNPADAKKIAEKHVRRFTSQAELALLSKKLATNDPVQSIYNTVTKEAEKTGEKDGSKWLKDLGTGLATSGIKALASGLAKKLF